MPKRILIAEDEASVRNAMRTFIESRSQFQVCEAVDGDDAIKKANVLQPDLVVLDLRMPKANGIEVAALLHVRTPHTPVVVFTDKLGASLTKILGIAAVVPKLTAWDRCSDKAEFSEQWCTSAQRRPRSVVVFLGRRRII